jgi:hypothetical protein
LRDRNKTRTGDFTGIHLLNGPVQGERKRSAQEADWLLENADAIQS